MPNYHQPTYAVCPHIAADGHTHRPFAILALDPETGAALCPSCLASEIETVLDVLPPGEISAALKFDACGHVPPVRGKQQHCRVCETGVAGALQTRHAELFFADRPKANRLARLLRYLGLRYDRHGIRTIGAEQTKAPAPVPYSSRMLKAESLWGDRARAARQWDEDREQRERTLRPPAQSVRVVPPTKVAVVA